MLEFFSTHSSTSPFCQTLNAHPLAPQIGFPLEATNREKKRVAVEVKRRAGMSPKKVAHFSALLNRRLPRFCTVSHKVEITRSSAEVSTETGIPRAHRRRRAQRSGAITPPVESSKRNHHPAASAKLDNTLNAFLPWVETGLVTTSAASA